MGDWDPLLRAAHEEAERFLAATRRPRETQLDLLQRLLVANRDTEFGDEHAFAGIDGIDAYRRNVPIRDYEGFRERIDRTAGGASSVLTAEPVAAFEITGGTSSGAKRIPVTARQIAAFRSAVLPWLARLAERRPEAVAGRVYATISPATRAEQTTAGGIPIGVPDAAYFGADLAGPFARLLAVPAETGAIEDVDAWRLATLQALVAAHDLSFVSLWSPTFLAALLEQVRPNAEAILRGLEAESRGRLERALRGPKVDTAQLWPRLDTISCWTDGPSRAYAAALAETFPHAAIDAKGVLATEGAVTIPWGRAGECVPALTSCFIEYVSESGEALLTDELATGRTYRVVLTTEAGLYRYDLGDVLECCGWRGEVPLLRFVGRAGLASDLVGEKLTDAFVSQAMAGLLTRAAVALWPAPAGYVLLIDGPDEPAAVLDQVEERLCRNPQYRFARKMGQLAPLRAEICPGLTTRLMDLRVKGGGRMGDAKPTSLLTGVPLEELTR